ncbi:hypothetical protein AB0I72_02660 [Nocardiopsis sp. NPDC049922]|uniref:hypothetical protein n=1 Tax=Nocardiopsis sp. NPDC049922 TaxID=3155157 RepID=UPI0033CDED2B
MKDDWRYGQPPGGDPYGPPGFDPYNAGTGGYGPPPGGYGDPGFAAPGGYPGQPYAERPSEGGIIGALVMAIILMVTCCGAFSVVGVIFAALALGEKHDPEKAARYKRYAWISNWINLGIVLLIALIYVVAIAFAIASEA